MPNLGDLLASLPFSGASATGPFEPTVAVVDVRVLGGVLVPSLAVRSVGVCSPTIDAGVLRRSHKRHVSGVLTRPVRTRSPQSAQTGVVARVVDVFASRDGAVCEFPSEPVCQPSSPPVRKRVHELSVPIDGQSRFPRPTFVWPQSFDLYPVPIFRCMTRPAKNGHFKRTGSFDAGPVRSAVAVRTDRLVAPLVLARGPRPPRCSFGHPRTLHGGVHHA